MLENVRTERFVKRTAGAAVSHPSHRSDQRLQVGEADPYTRADLPAWRTRNAEAVRGKILEYGHRPGIQADLDFTTKADAHALMLVRAQRLRGRGVKRDKRVMPRPCLPPLPIAKLP